jgi:hypothetical protein
VPLSTKQQYFNNMVVVNLIDEGNWSIRKQPFRENHHPAD